MRLISFIGLLLLCSCQFRLPVEHNLVYLSEDVSYSISSIKASNLEKQFIHQVKFRSEAGDSFNYLVQLEISANKNHMAFVATSLLGVPLISFEMQGDKVLNVIRTSEQVPTADRLVVDLQLMLWPSKRLSSISNVSVSEHCKSGCERLIFIDNQAIAKISYSNMDLSGDILFENLIHSYRMTIKNL